MATLITLFLIAAVYLIPALIAINVKHKQQTAIILLNIFAGWTFVGWLGALIWAVLKSDK